MLLNFWVNNCLSFVFVKGKKSCRNETLLIIISHFAIARFGADLVYQVPKHQSAKKSLKFFLKLSRFWLRLVIYDAWFFYQFKFLSFFLDLIIFDS